MRKTTSESGKNVGEFEEREKSFEQSEKVTENNDLTEPKKTKYHRKPFI